MDVAAGAVTTEASGVLPDGYKDFTLGGVLLTVSGFLCLGKGWTFAFGLGTFCLAAEAPMDVVATGAVTNKVSEALPDGSKDLSLGGRVSSIDPSLLLRFWWYNQR